MKAEKNSMAGGVFMLVGLVVLLAVPMVLGHFVMVPAVVETVQASAAVAQ